MFLHFTLNLQWLGGATWDKEKKICTHPERWQCLLFCVLKHMGNICEMFLYFLIKKKTSVIQLFKVSQKRVRVCL